MATFEQQEIPFQERRRLRTHSKFRRGIYLLPSMFTAANLVCGYYAIVAALLGGPENFNLAALSIGIAIVFDSLDGRVARLTGATSEFGMQFDSLADVVSFGVAPAVLAYTWGVRHLPNQETMTVEQIGQLGWLCCMVFLVCCAWRLARFNVHGMAPGGSKYFVGMPTPAAAAVIAALVHGFKSPIYSKFWAFAWVLLPAALGLLMTSTIRYYSFKDIPWMRRQRSLTIVLLVVCAAAILRYSEVALVVIACAYAVTGLVLHVIRLLRRRSTPRPA